MKKCYMLGELLLFVCLVGSHGHRMFIMQAASCGKKSSVGRWAAQGGEGPLPGAGTSKFGAAGDRQLFFF